MEPPAIRNRRLASKVAPAANNVFRYASTSFCHLSRLVLYFFAVWI